MDQTESPPFQEAHGDWFITRTTVTIPQCSAYDDMGNYSLRSYMLPKIVTHTKIQICRGTANGASTLATTRDLQKKPDDTAWEIYNHYGRAYDGPCPPLAAH